jgi:hypothetical protein
MDCPSHSKPAEDAAVDGVEVFLPSCKMSMPLEPFPMEFSTSKHYALPDSVQDARNRRIEEEKKTARTIVNGRRGGTYPGRLSPSG